MGLIGGRLISVCRRKICVKGGSINFFLLAPFCVDNGGIRLLLAYMTSGPTLSIGTRHVGLNVGLYSARILVLAGFSVAFVGRGSACIPATAPLLACGRTTGVRGGDLYRPFLLGGDWLARG